MKMSPGNRKWGVERGQEEVEGSSNVAVVFRAVADYLLCRRQVKSKQKR